MKPPLRTRADVDGAARGPRRRHDRRDRHRPRAAPPRREGRRVRPGGVRHRRPRDRAAGSALELVARGRARPADAGRAHDHRPGAHPRAARRARSRRAPPPTSRWSIRSGAGRSTRGRFRSKSRNTPFDGLGAGGPRGGRAGRRAARSTTIGRRTPVLRVRVVSDAATATPSWRSPTARSSAGAPSARVGEARGRGRLQHQHDRLPGDPHRSVLRGADRRDDVSRDRQRRREPRGRRVAAAVRARLRRARVPRRAVAAGAREESLGAYLARHGTSRASRASTRARWCATCAITARRRRCSRASTSDADAAGAQGARTRPSLVGPRPRARASPAASRTTGREGPWTLGGGRTADEVAAARGRPPLRVVAYDFGIKCNILRNLVGAAARCASCPRRRRRRDVLALRPDGVFLSNGPGDPDAVAGAPRDVAALLGQGARLRHLPRPPDPRPRARRHDVQAQVRPPRRQPAGEGPDDGQGRDHVAEPRLRGRRRTRSAAAPRSRTST